MITVSDYAQFAQAVYGFAKDQAVARDKFNLLVHNKYKNHNSDIPFAPHPDEPFYAELWVNKHDEEAIIAIRGTDNLSNIISDVRDWGADVLFGNQQDRLPERLYHQAQIFFLKCSDYLTEFFPNVKLSLTGHSLGGALAQLLVALPVKPHIVVAFNAPGVGYMVKKADAVTSFIHNINARYGMINKIGKVIGSINYVDVAEEESIAKDYFKQQAELHHLNHEVTSTHNPLTQLALSQEIIALGSESDAALLASVLAQHKISHLIEAIQQNPSVAQMLF